MVACRLCVFITGSAGMLGKLAQATGLHVGSDDIADGQRISKFA